MPQPIDEYDEVVEFDFTFPISVDYDAVELFIASLEGAGFEVETDSTGSGTTLLCFVCELALVVPYDGYFDLADRLYDVNEVPPNSFIEFKGYLPMFCWDESGELIR